MIRENVIIYFIIGCLHAIYIMQADENNVFKLNQVVVTIFIWPVLTYIFLKEMVTAAFKR